MPPRTTIFEAACLLGPEGPVHDGALCVERGRVREIVRSRARVRRLVAAGARRVDLGEGCIAPAFVDAHAHLELGALAGGLPRGGGRGSFTAWIRALLAARAPLRRKALEAGARAGALRLLETGTTLVGDVDSTGVVAAACRGLPLRVRRYREVLDAGDPTRARAAISSLSRTSRRGGRIFEGVSPHAPYTISPALWKALGRTCRARRAHVMIHFAETREETEWLEHGRGPMSAILTHAPRQSGLDAIEAAGLLGPRTVLVHGNCATALERARIARSKAALVHCPGTHAFFRRAPFDAQAWLAAGVTLALGTDSMASNDDLDMGRELALFARATPRIPPAVLFDCATRNGARALGFAGRAGELLPGAWADFVLYDVGAERGDLGAARSRTGRARGEDVLEAIVHGSARRLGTWVGGSPVSVAGATERPDGARGTEKHRARIGITLSRARMRRPLKRQG